MTHLSDKQKQILFDYCLGLASDEQVKQAEQLISSNKDASEIYSNLKSAFSVLDRFEAEVCPDDLSERTILRLNNAARSSQARLSQLLEDEKARTVPVRSRFWLNLGQIAAAAAIIILFMGTYFAPLRRARLQSWQQRCQKQLAGIGSGLQNYVSDHDGRLPSVAAAAGAPWWKVGQLGKENHSNTRNVWLLVKNGYVEPVDFVCPGRSEGRALQFDSGKVSEYDDFPSRRYVTYSFRIRCNQSAGRDMGSKYVLMSDLNPLFEKLPAGCSGSLNLQVDDRLAAINSSNHNRRGQNVLFTDGRAGFIRTRYTDDSKRDDIFTLQNTRVYKGVEVPSCATDAFLAP